MKKTFLLSSLLLFIIGISLFLNDRSAVTPVAAIEQVRTSVGQIYDEIDLANGKMVFYVRGDNQMINAEYVKKTWTGGWKWGFGGGHSIPPLQKDVLDTEHDWTDQYFPSTKGTPFDLPSPMLFGVILTNDIQTIRVQSERTKESFDAHILSNDLFPFKLWYVLVPEEQGVKFTLEALSSAQKVVSVKTSDWQIHNE
ncbi:hypothetical protein EDM56_14915 [Brevibacillus fluminis]|uniref:Uncharacterized protein n=1 Tax=Brevibacillus fluminis TaxID=511487 RepID=A0A3M8DG28_9BACL|nr:hypothetical protein [Brevibacillus fluminis]RNB86994.1 hypothetical protein EDM56_14915 [Brevibacillus fluminis]